MAEQKNPQAQPELSLSELAAEFDPPVSKSCMNHRMRKLMEEANDVHE